MTDNLQYWLGAGIGSILLTQIIIAVREVVTQHQSRQRELTGLLRILFTEVDENQGFLEFFERVHGGGMKHEDKRKAYERHLDSEDISLEAWEETRLKLAQLLASDEFATLASYYRALASLKEPAPIAEWGDESYVLEVRPELARHLFRRGKKVEAIIRAYVPDVTTDDIAFVELLE